MKAVDQRTPSVDPLRLLLVAPTPPPMGGIATNTELLLRYLEHAPGVSITLVDSAVRWRRPTQITMGLRIAGGTIQAIQIWQRTLDACSDDVDVAQVATAGGPGFLRDILILRSLRRRNIPSVLSIHMGRLPVVLDSRSCEGFLARMALSTASEITVLDHYSESILRCHLPDLAVSKCPNFIDLSEMNRQAIKEAMAGGIDFDLIHVGAVIPSKGVLELVQACAGIPGVRLALVGPVERDFADLLQRLARDSGLSLLVSGAMSKQDAHAMIARSRALALASHTEGFPYVVLEAMALARPVIATPVGAIPEMLALNTERPCGRSVEVGDVQTLKAAVEDLLASPNAWSQMGKWGRERVTQIYSSEAVVPSLINLWRRVAGQRNQN